MPSHNDILIFPCRCGKRLRVGNELAGQAVQCPACGLLLNVPTPEDHLEEDGTFGLAEDLPPTHVDEHEDLDFELNQPPTLAYASQNTPPRPNFVAQTFSNSGFAPPVVADRPRVTLPYDQWAYDSARRSLWLLPLDLLQPANVIVVMMIFGAFVIAEFMTFIAVGGAFPLAFFALILVLASVAHYVNVIDETGPEARDEMPPPLRDVSVWDDLLKPVSLLAVALTICFWPAVLMWFVGGWATGGGYVAGAAALAALGAFAFPAIILTLVAGGTFMNLMPWRVVRVMAIGGRNYLIAAGLLLPLTVALHATAFLILGELLVSLYGRTLVGFATPPSPILLVVLGHMTLLLAVFTAHLLAWWIGRLHQRGHERYGWLLQRHERAEEKSGDAKAIEARERIAAARSNALEIEAKHASDRVRDRLPV